MEGWIVVLEDGFEVDDHDVDQEGDGELIVPAPWVAVWKDDPDPGKLDRPAVKPKDKRPPYNHSEVYIGNRAVSIGTAYASHSAALVLELRGVKAGEKVRAVAMAMGVSHHNDGLIGGGLGQVIGIGDGPSIDGVQYGEWWSTDHPEWSERDWRMIEVEAIAGVDDPWLVLRSDAREKWEAQYSHFDAVSVEVWRDDGGSPTPPGGVLDELDKALDDLIGVYERLGRVRDHIANNVIECVPVNSLGGSDV